MISALILALFASQTPQHFVAKTAVNAYVECLRGKSALPPLEQRVAEEQVRLASQQCGASRQVMVEALLPLVPYTRETRDAQQQEAERQAALIDSDVANWLTRKAVNVVPSEPK
jgi:hypothetical protein